MGVRTNGSGGGALAMASASAAQIDKRLAAIEHHTKRLADFFEGKHYYEIELSFAALKEENSVGFSEQIPQGYIFVPQRIEVTAPESSRLEIFQNNQSAANFLEVITNVQVYSEGILGPWVVFGPCRLAFLLTKAKVAGTCTVSISGNLIKRDLGSHIP